MFTNKPDLCFIVIWEEKYLKIIVELINVLRLFKLNLQHLVLYKQLTYLLASDFQNLPIGYGNWFIGIYILIYVFLVELSTSHLLV